ncbi:MAG: DHH family phosphoesterase, partial [Alphaproteobacteria bacterium]|nr:DHH family phosphoesterase [Alphaproteobacteria bacterium]
MTIKEWVYKKYNDIDNNKSLIDKLLISRGITTDEDMHEFTHPLEMKLTPPEAFCDMQKAVTRIVTAINNEEKIVIYGDFDADGLTSTSLLYKTLKYIGADANYFIPDREKEGHGFESNALINLMKNLKPKLIISVDCGISNVKEVAFIKSFGVDVIITDHHEAPEVLPDATAIINPKAPNALSEDLSAKQINNLASLAGVGVAFKLAQALLNFYNKTEFIWELLPYVAVGTVADVVPLIGENRYFVTKGLELISKGKHPGIKRLIEAAGYSAEKNLTSEVIAFGVAPRINASGRLESVDASIKLLISENPQEIEMSVKTLN